VVYPAHGIGVVEKIEKLKEKSQTKNIYTIRIDEVDMTIKVEEKSAAKIGIRSVIKDREVSKIMKVLKTKSKPASSQNWHKRQKSYLDRIKSGSVYELAEILRELTQIMSRKELSFGEQRLYDNVRLLLVLEIAEAKGMEKQKASLMLDKAFES
jgi:CarD family transcriptional regulator